MYRFYIFVLNKLFTSVNMDSQFHEFVDVWTIVLRIAIPGKLAQLTANESVLEIVHTTTRVAHVRRRFSGFARALPFSFRPAARRSASRSAAPPGHTGTVCTYVPGPILIYISTICDCARVLTVLCAEYRRLRHHY